MENICPSVKTCPIFINNVLSTENVATAYRKLYCEAGQAKYATCKRFIVSGKAGSCPADVMPNTSRTIEEILAKMG